MVANRIDQVFEKKKERVLNVYFTAGFPQLNDTVSIIQTLEEVGADLIEIGIPFSDPVADGPTIQDSNQIALNNGMNLQKLLQQLQGVREKVQLPLILMGYINPIIQYGVEKFCKECAEVGVDGLILPDLPMYEYLQEYQSIFHKYNLHNIFLITPQTSEARIREIDENSYGFIYMVSSASITGAKKEITQAQIDYFHRVNDMGLKNPRLIGFGISNNTTFNQACQYASGAIIGSAFIKLLGKSQNLEEDITTFIQNVLN